MWVVVWVLRAVALVAVLVLLMVLVLLLVLVLVVVSGTECLARDYVDGRKMARNTTDAIFSEDHVVCAISPCF
jgi:hypothetical protein